jgi:hypothetical protein
VRSAAIPAACALLWAASPAFAADPADCPKQLVEKPEVDPATGRETAGARAARRELEMIVSMVVGYESCARDVPSFKTEFGPAYRAWRENNRDALRRYDANAHAKRYVACGLDHERRRMAAESPAGKAEKVQTCQGLVGPGIENIAAQRPR